MFTDTNRRHSAAALQRVAPTVAKDDFWKRKSAKWTKKGLQSCLLFLKWVKNQAAAALHSSMFLSFHGSTKPRLSLLNRGTILVAVYWDAFVTQSLYMSHMS